MGESKKTILVKYDKDIECLLEEKGVKFDIEDFLVLPNVKESAIDTTKIEIEIPSIYDKYFEYFELYFKIKKKFYLENIIKREIESRNDELGIF